MKKTYFFVDDHGEISTITDAELKTIAVGCWTNGALDINTITTDEAESIVANSDHCDAENVCFDLEDARNLAFDRLGYTGTMIIVDGEVHALDISRLDDNMTRFDMTSDILGNACDWKSLYGHHAWEADEPADIDQFREWLRDTCARECGFDVYLDNEQIK